MLFDKLIKLLPVNLRLFDDAGGGMLELAIVLVVQVKLKPEYNYLAKVRRLAQRKGR